MDNKKCIEILETLKCDLDDNWDKSDPEIIQIINRYFSAIDHAIISLSSKNMVGELIIEDKKYIICGQELS
ncbi:hypothetical protein [Konateibacter massiliensis]|uniref:hypothetical protein n=1 Tax=Konateibacter massiliensis TaxID=2002841 RepID=UPI000C14B9D7|nr:hypothetical protein [Konateibacter massiliensis]